MASTDRGAVLTDAHRRRQVRLAIAAESELRRAWRLLDLADIDGTRARWLSRTIAVLSQRYGLSQRQAEAYLASFRLAETGTTVGSLVVPQPGLVDWVRVLDATGPQSLKRRIGEGVAPSVAYLRVRDQFLAESRKIIMSGGRGVVRESARQDRRAVGWRRVSDGDPCTFCAMLVSRGPAYTTEAKALAKADTDDPYHKKCGCTVEVVYGEWTPTALEQKWVDAYFDAAEEAEAVDGRRTADTVLWRMRQAGNFGDSPARRNAIHDH